MAGKFIELKQAAEQLGITAERLLELRDAGKVHGYRDGASWKFKTAEIDNLAAELGSEEASSSEELNMSDSAPLAGDDLEALLDVDLGEDSDEDMDSSSILISDEAKENGESGSSSTVIGRDDQEKKEDSDLKLAEEAPKSGDSDVSLVPESGEGSDVKVVADDSKPSEMSDYDLKLADEEDLSDELELSDELDFESDDALVLGEDSELSLADSDNVVLDDSAGSDLAIGASDSGINVGSPSDSGLSLEEGPSGLSSSDALELPEDEDMISLEDELAASPDDATQLQQDEEFLLSPSGDMMGDESSDSGSQVIALEDSGAFEEAAPVADSDSAEPLLVADDSEALEAQLESFEGAASVESGAMAIGVTEMPEAPYSIWNLMSLIFIVLLLSVTGMLMADVVRNMWAWSGDSSVASGLANSIVDMLGMK